MKKRTISRAALKAAEMNEDLFLAMISAKSETRVKARQLAVTEKKLHLSQMARKEEQRAAQRELDGMAAFVGVLSGLVVTGICVLAAPIWTAVLPITATMAVMRKAGWV